MNLKILLLPGDGVGVEVTRAAVEVLEAVATEVRTHAGVDRRPVGRRRDSQDRIAAAAGDRGKGAGGRRDASGRGGLPEFDNAPPEQRPERGLLGLRKVLGVFANLRPVRTWPALVDSSPLKNHLVEGTDMIIVRELTGGLYYGEPRGIENDRAVNTMVYTRAEIERVARKAFQARAGPQEETDQRRQIERDREFAALAARGDRCGARISGRRAGPSAGG